MKTVKLILFAFITISFNLLCSAQAENEKQPVNNAETNTVEVFYFHFTRRCPTCTAVENVSKKAVAELYGDKVPFTGYNLDEDNGRVMGEKLGVSGQTLLIVSGDTKIDITNEGFLNARSNPEKLKSVIKGKIDPLL